MSRIRIGLAVTLALALAGPTTDARAQETVLRAVLSNELNSLDPVVSTTTSTRAYGYMVYDTLIAMDSEGNYHPQMLESWRVSEDGRIYTFRLRPGLEWHDGKPVTAEDCVASIRRWAERDGLGRRMIGATRELRIVDANTFELELSRPFGLVIEALGKPSLPVPFMMPARIASTPASQAITETIGSGPYTFHRDEWRHGDRAVFRRNQAYRPRTEAANGLAGGKTVHFDRVEFVSLMDPATRVAALQGAEVDYLEYVPPDFVEPLRRNRDLVVTGPRDGLGQSMSLITLNHTQPPFNNPLMRRALQQAIIQSEITAGMGLPEDLRLSQCLSIYPCNSPFESSAGTEDLREASTERARTLLREAGYNNERIVVLHPTDSAALHPISLVAIDLMKRAGFNVDVWSSDYSSVAQRFLSREPVERGGWSVVALAWSGIDLASPAMSTAVAYNCANYPGWPCDPEITPLLEQYTAEADPTRRKAIADQVQARFHANVNRIIAGQYVIPRGYRANLRDVVSFSYPVFWGVRRVAR